MVLSSLRRVGAVLLVLVLVSSVGAVLLSNVAPTEEAAGSSLADAPVTPLVSVSPAGVPSGQTQAIDVSGSASAIPSSPLSTAPAVSTSATVARAAVSVPSELGQVYAQGSQSAAPAAGPGSPESSGDYFAESPSSIIGSATGTFPSVTGLTSETDSTSGSGAFGLQINTNTFSCNTAYTGGLTTTCWEQFVYETNVDGLYGPGVFIDYTLTNYVTGSVTSCPSTGPPGGSGWYVFSTQPKNCYANSAIVAAPVFPITDLGLLTLSAEANYGGSGTDQVQICLSGGGCYGPASNPDNVLDLGDNWLISEFNVFGMAGGSEAVFNAGTEITVSEDVTDQSGNSVSPYCGSGVVTGEYNNLYLGVCTNSTAGIEFTEGTLEFSCSVSPSDVTVLNGQTATYEVTVTLLAGASEPIALSVVSGLPSGATPSFSPSTVFPTSTSTLSIATSSSGSLGDFTFTVEGDFMGLAETCTANLHVYDFTVNLSPSDQSVLRGGSTSYAVSLTLLPGSSTTGLPGIQLSELGLPSDATYAFSASSIVPTTVGCTSGTPEDCQSLEVTTAGPPTGSLGDFTFAVIGTDPSASGGYRDASANLHIFDFTVDIAPMDQTVVRGGTASYYSVNLTLVPGSSTTGIPAFSLSVAGLPSDASYAFSAATIVPTAAGCTFETLEDCQSLEVTTAGPPSGSLGDFTFTVTASAPGPSDGARSSSANLHIFDFTVTLTPASVTLTQGASAKMTVSVALVPGSTTVDLPSVALALSGLPAGVVAVGFPSVLAIGASQTFTVQTAGVGSYVSCPQVSTHGGQNLKGQNLAHCNLVGYNLAFDNLQNANLEYADLANAILAGANLQGATLASANTSGTNFLGANLAGVDLSSATPIGVFTLTATGSVDGASRLGTASLTVLGDQLSGDNFDLANLYEANLYGDVAVGAKFQAANLLDANLGITDLAGANFLLANLAFGDLVGATLNGATLELADLYAADLYGDVGIGANFLGADLAAADLAGSDFATSNFEGVTAVGANFAGDDLVNTDFAFANLSYSDLAGANFTGANLFDANLHGANTTGTVF